MIRQRKIDIELNAAVVIPRAWQGARIWLGFSGGLDSTVLLHLLQKNYPGKVSAIHVHHGLQTAADDWAAHCTQVCEALQVPLKIVHVVVESEGKGLEAAARLARYAKFAEVMQAGDLIATAHHQDDQAETVLLRLLRGSGIDGLSAIPEQRPFASGLMWRPLLAVTRSRLRRYAQIQGLSWIEDPQNQNPKFARSYVRQEILPRLCQHWPAAAANLARSAALSAEASAVLAELAEADLAHCRSADGSLAISELQACSSPRRNNLIRYWIQCAGLPTPYLDSLRRLESEVIDAAPDANPVLSWPGAEIRRYRGHLFAMSPLPKLPEAFISDWPETEILQLPQGCGALLLSGRPENLVSAQFRLVAPGDRFSPDGRLNSRSLKNMFQEQGVPPWVRIRTPVLEQAGRPIWIGGLGWASQAESACEIRWLDAPPGAKN